MKLTRTEHERLVVTLFKLSRSKDKALAKMAGDLGELLDPPEVEPTLPLPAPEGKK